MGSTQTHGGRHDSAASRSKRFRRAGGERGVALIEFAIVAPLLFLILFGVIEFGWGFYEKIDVRHGAREGARLAAVDFGAGNLATLKAEICDRMENSSLANVDIQITKTGGSLVGAEVTVTIRRPLDTLTGFLDPFIGGKTLSSTIKTRLEQDASYADEPGDGANPSNWDDCG